MSSLESLNAAHEMLSQAQSELTAEADAMPTIEAGDIVAAQAERIAPILTALEEIIGAMSGQDPGDTSATDTAIADGGGAAA